MRRRCRRTIRINVDLFGVCPHANHHRTGGCHCATADHHAVPRQDQHTHQRHIQKVFYSVSHRHQSLSDFDKASPAKKKTLPEDGQGR